MLLTLDPGISAANATGVALFNPLIRQLIAADVIRRNPKLYGLDAQFDIADRALGWAMGNLPEGERLTAFVAEWPQVYKHEREKDPNVSLLPLCGIVGHASGMMAHIKRELYQPREWKGSIDGTAFSQRILERLDRRELSIVQAVVPASLRHNATDAVGLGLKYLGRLERMRAVHVEPSYVKDEA